ncbi:hypothetical protein PWW31_02040 [Vibrio harveyi]|nr:hypothetical protein PWW31_02040 [Vibrio harveyi]
MEELDRQDKAGKEDGSGAFFYKYVNGIFNEFKTLQPTELKELRLQFLRNNNIKALCEGRANPVRYSSVAQTELDKKIKKFFSELYSCGFFNLKIVRETIGANLHDHYNDFAKRMICLAAHSVVYNRWIMSMILRGKHTITIYQQVFTHLTP